MENLVKFVMLMALAAVLSAFMCGLLQFCWNEVIVSVFKAQALSFWQTYGLMVITGFVGRCFQPVKSNKE